MAFYDCSCGSFRAILRRLQDAVLSQVRIDSAMGIGQSCVNRIMRGTAGPIEEFAVFERIAIGLGLPDHACMLLGLAPLDSASPMGSFDDEHQEQMSALAARLDAASTIDATMVTILSTDTNDLRLLDRRLGVSSNLDSKG
ncbi:hypothetical protein [Nonomuraea glycinis]|uniref:hypothetical protein n=1 Tax=Nonomuraea glycinis TaxID=2047744 RepID=UPI002E125381|nr:hypothetical protein OHA68_17040 [Nonomuraea glycinis]